MCASVGAWLGNLTTGHWGLHRGSPFAAGLPPPLRVVPSTHFCRFHGPGNVGNTTATPFWVDGIPPLPIALRAAPEPFSTSSLAAFELKAPQGASSAGQLRFGAWVLVAT